jgi:hypothetical protein
MVTANRGGAGGGAELLESTVITAVSATSVSPDAMALNRQPSGPGDRIRSGGVSGWSTSLA